MKTVDKNTNLLLGIESSGETCAVGLAEEGRVIMQISANIPHIHSQKLASFIDEVIKHTGYSLAQLSAIILAAGPGSFTGLRIGYAVAKGIAHPHNIPLIEVPSLDVLACQVGIPDRLILPIIDAHRGEVFCALYRNKNGEFRRLSDYRLFPIANLSTISEENTILIGENANQLIAPLKEKMPESVVILSGWYAKPRLEALIELGYRKFLKNEYSDLEKSEPLYMRKFKGKS